MSETSQSEDGMEIETDSDMFTSDDQPPESKDEETGDIVRTS